MTADLSAAPLAIGTSYTFTITVDDTMLAGLSNTVVHPLYGTAAMLTHMEWASRQLIVAHLKPGEEGVGHEVNLTHAHPAPVGTTVQITATVSAIEPRRITTRCEAWALAANQPQTLLGQATIVQALVLQHALYDKAQLLFPTATTAHTTQPVPNDTGVTTLFDNQQQPAFSVTLLAWEHPGATVCTRYDEWLICEITIFANGQPATLKAPCLLRDEVREIIAACRALSTDGTPYQSNFLEPMLTLKMAPVPGGFQADMALVCAPKQSPVTTQVVTTAEQLQQFANNLEDQLSAFPSLL